MLRTISAMLLALLCWGCSPAHRIAFRDPVIVFAGDSLTQQWQWYWKNEFPSTSNFHNAGVVGNTSDLLLARFDEDVLTLHPEIVEIMIGTNDVIDEATYGSIPLATTEANILAMAMRVRERGALVIIATIPPVMNSYPNAQEINGQIRDLNAWILSLSAEPWYRFAVADYYSAPRRRWCSESLFLRRRQAPLKSRWLRCDLPNHAEPAFRSRALRL